MTALLCQPAKPWGKIASIVQELLHLYTARLSRTSYSGHTCTQLSSRAFCGRIKKSVQRTVCAAAIEILSAPNNAVDGCRGRLDAPLGLKAGEWHSEPICPVFTSRLSPLPTSSQQLQRNGSRYARCPHRHRRPRRCPAHAGSPPGPLRRPASRRRHGGEFSVVRLPYPQLKPVVAAPAQQQCCQGQGIEAYRFSLSIEMLYDSPGVVGGNWRALAWAPVGAGTRHLHAR